MLLNGKPVIGKIKSEIEKTVKECRDSGRDLPKLAILRVGNRVDDIAYESSLLKNCEELGIEAEVKEAENNIKMADFIELLNSLNEDVKIHGILILRPLPEQLDIDIVSRTINPNKDIDCMSPFNIEKIFIGDKSGIPPCTAEAVIEILKYYNYNLNGKNVVIVNRSMVLGKPLSMMFLDEDSTVTICHTKTEGLSALTSKADIVVTGVGRAKYFDKKYFTSKSVIIDVGINNDGENRLCGDVDFDDVYKSVAAITPVPNGVGTVTSMILLNHVVKSMQLNR